MTKFEITGTITKYIKATIEAKDKDEAWDKFCDTEDKSIYVVDEDIDCDTTTTT